MACKCQDTGTKRCRREQYHTGLWEWEQHQLVRVDRKVTNQSLNRWLDDESEVLDLEPVIMYVPADMDPATMDWDWWGEPYGLYDHDCSCRRCLLHDDPGGCLRR